MYYGIIYMIRNKINGKIYFGQTIEQKGFNGRYKGGQWWKYSDNEHLKNSYDKYGLDNFEVIKQFDVAHSKEELDYLEDMYICLYDTINPKYGYNKKRGGSHGKHTEEALQKQRENQPKLYGENNPFYGKHHTDETKTKIAQANMGRQHTEESKRKMSESQKVAQLGHEVSEETRKKISKANSNPSEETRKKISDSKKGKSLTDEHKQKIKDNAPRGSSHKRAKKVICVETGEIFDSASQAGEVHNVTRGMITLCCQGERKTVKGKQFKYYVEENVNE